MPRRIPALLVLGLAAALLTGSSAAGAAEVPTAAGVSISAAGASASAPTVATAAPTRPAVADGAFVVVRESGEVYRIVGGAPVYVSSWVAFGGPPPLTSISLAQLNAMPLTPADGTFVVGAQRGEVYRFAGGAPLYVTSWDQFGGPQPVTAVDVVALDNAGQAGVFSHVRATPADGTFVVGGIGWGHVYRFAGGAPVYVSSLAAFGGQPRLTVVDHSALDFAGAGGAFNHARFYPADGTYIHGAQTGRVYQVQGGIALFVADWSLVGGPKLSTAVDQVAINLAGGTQFAHLRGVGTL